jgi:rare lipoprotein A
MRRSRRFQVAAGAVILGIPIPAVALAAGQANAQSALQVNLNRHHLAYGEDVVVAGNASPSSAGQAAELEFAPAGATGWQPLATTTVRGDGHFHLAARLRRSGLLKVLMHRPSGQPGTGVVGAGAASAGDPGSSIPESVTVAARFRLSRAPINVLAGQTVNVRGRLLPGVAGRRVRLQGRVPGGPWHTLAATRTGGWGGFDLRYTPTGTGPKQLRVRFAGDRLNTWSGTHAGQLTAYRQSMASWYSDAGTTGCGFHAYFGVANTSLPCGTSVTFANGGRTVTAVVDDRGPYVGGREWDLNQNTAAALGFGGVGVIWSSK